MKTFAERVDEGAEKYGYDGDNGYINKDAFTGAIEWLLTEMGLSEVEDPIEAVKKMREALEKLSNHWVDFELCERTFEAQIAHKALMPSEKK